jgi:hypothetical protein
MLRSLFEGSPGRLRVAGIAAVVVCLVFALLGASAFQARGNALADANADAAQLIRVQQIASDVVLADSLLTSAFPSPADESGEQVDAFNQALTRASQFIADAAAAKPEDGPALANVSDALGQYRQYAASARIYNKQGDQVGYGYLRQAGAALRGQDAQNNPNLITGTGMLPELDKLITASTQRVDDAYAASRWATLQMVLAALVVLVGLVWVQIWLARRTRRYLNVPLFSAGVAVLLVVVVGAFVMAGAQSRADRVRDTSYTSLKSLADARIAANAAKSDASIAFLYQRIGGSAQVYRDDYAVKIAQVTRSLSNAKLPASDPAVTSFTTWKQAADPVFDTQPGDWTKVAQTLASPSSPFNKPFTTLDTQLRQQIDEEAAKVGKDLGTGNVPLIVVGWLALVVGILAAVASWAGISQRLEDYR